MARATLTNVYSNSADAMAALLALHFPNGSILDVNYGLGVFYRNGQRQRVIGLDVLCNGDVIGDNRHLPFSDRSFDVGVLDPPYKRGDGVRYEKRYGRAPHTEQQVTRSYLDALPELLRVCRAGLIIKCQDGTDGHRFHARSATLIKSIECLTKMQPHDMAFVVRSGVPDVMAQGAQHFFMQRVSYFIVYRWRNCQYAPVRF